MTIEDLLSENWRTLSICGPEHDHLMFSNKKSGRGRNTEIEAAIQLCRQCPVSQWCFDTANQRNERFGVWGGVDFSANDKEGRNKRRLWLISQQKETA